MSTDLLERAAYRNRWADAYRALVTEGAIPDGAFEPVRMASADSWDCGERLNDTEIRARVEALTREARA